MIKKIVSILILAALMLTFSACGNSAYKKYDSSNERYNCYLPDYIDVPDYKNLEVPNLDYTVTMEDVQRRINKNLSAMIPSIDNPVDGAARLGDIVDIVTTSYIGDEPLSLLTFKKNSKGLGRSIVLGTYEFYVPEIDDSIVGMKPGETKTITFNLPDPYYPSLSISGKEVKMDITLGNYYTMELPEESDELFSKLFGYSVSAYQAYIKNQLETEFKEYLETYKSDCVWNYLFENSKVLKMPPENDTIYEELLNDYRKAASEEDITLLEYVKKNFSYETLDEFYVYLKEYVSDTCKREMILYYIARCENLNYDDSYYKTELMDFAKSYEITDFNEAESFVEYSFGLDQFKEHVRLNFVYDWLGDNAKVRDDIKTYNNDLNK